MLQYAGGPVVPSTHQHEGVSGGGTARRHQRDMAVQSALALHQQFTVHGDVFKVFRYLGRLLSQDDNDIQAMQSQLCKARGTWARVRQVLLKKNAPLRVSAKFYKAIIVQSVLLNLNGP